MTTNAHHPWLHRFAVLTACAALLPIGMGALVTTLGAGMAFLDWPSSDGHNMLLYPWLKDIAQGNTHKAVEHGHRLAGMMIGLMTIALVVIAWRTESRRWVKWLTAGVLLAVIVQGILGGTRVLADDPRLAMVHGSFAAWVFTLMAAVALVTSKSWFAVSGLDGSSEFVACGSRIPKNSDDARHKPEFLGIRLQPYVKPLAVITPIVIYGQYILGGLLRHLGMALHEHLALAFLVLLFVSATAISAHRSRIAWLRNAGWLLFGVTLAQALLGAGAWLTRFGLSSAGYVGGQHPALQVVFRSSHTVCGMLVLMTAVLYAIRVFRVDRVAGRFNDYPEGVAQQSPGSPSECEAHPGLGSKHGANPEGVPQAVLQMRSARLCNPFRVENFIPAVTQGALRCAARPWAVLLNPFGVTTSRPDSDAERLPISDSAVQGGGR